MSRARAAGLPLICLAAFALVLAIALPSVALATQCLIFVPATLASSFLLSRVGLPSFGQSVPFGIGSYACALGILHLGLHGLSAALFGVAAATAAGLLVGTIAVQRRGVYFFMLTLALAQMVYFIAYAASDLTGGDNGLVDVPRPPIDLLGLDLVSIASPWRFYVLVVACCIFIYWLLNRISRSPFGAVLMGIRENEDRATALGYNTRLYKIVAFTLAAAITGLAGALYALYLQFVPLSNIELGTSQSILVMTILGGTGSLFGGVLGSVAYILLEHFLSNLWSHWPLIVGVLLVGVALGLRGGLWFIVQSAMRIAAPGLSAAVARSELGPAPALSEAPAQEGNAGG